MRLYLSRTPYSWKHIPCEYDDCPQYALDEHGLCSFHLKEHQENMSQITLRRDNT